MSSSECLRGACGGACGASPVRFSLCPLVPCPCFMFEISSWWSCWRRLLLAEGFNHFEFGNIPSHVWTSTSTFQYMAIWREAGALGQNTPGGFLGGFLSLLGISRAGLCCYRVHTPRPVPFQLQKPGLRTRHAAVHVGPPTFWHPLQRTPTSPRCRNGRQSEGVGWTLECFELGRWWWWHCATCK